MKRERPPGSAPSLRPGEAGTDSALNDPMPVGTPYTSSIEHILAGIECLDVRIEVQVRHARELQKQDDLQGLYISEQEVDTILAQPIGLPRWASDPPAGAPDVKAVVGQLRAQIE